MLAPKTQDYGIADAISEAYSTFQELRDELTNWRDNMDGANMTHLPKYDEVSEAVDALEQFCDEEPELPDVEGLEDLRFKVNLPTKKKLSRAARFDHATDLLSAAASAIDDFTHDKDEDAMSEVQDLHDKLEEDAGQGVDFPGMY